MPASKGARRHNGCRDITHSYPYPLYLTPLAEGARAASPTPVLQGRKRGEGKGDVVGYW